MWGGVLQSHNIAKTVFCEWPCGIAAAGIAAAVVAVTMLLLLLPPLLLPLLLLPVPRCAHRVRYAEGPPRVFT